MVARLLVVARAQLAVVRDGLGHDSGGALTLGAHESDGHHLSSPGSSDAAADLRFDQWLRDLEAKHLADLTFPEVSRALRALSSTYVERRSRLTDGAALSGAGKRAAFALFYGPLHFLLVRHIVTSVPKALARVRTLVDLGCGTGASGAAWASACAQPPSVIGIDRHQWALEESRATYRAFNLRACSRSDDIVRVVFPPQSTVLAAFAVNELGDTARDALLVKLLAHVAQHQGRVLIVEPLAGFVTPWWKAWSRAFEAAGGGADQWRAHVELPSIVQKLDRAAGLSHRELTGKFLALGI